jgi:hypothetical protein
MPCHGTCESEFRLIAAANFLQEPVALYDDGAAIAASVDVVAMDTSFDDTIPMAPIHADSKTVAAAAYVYVFRRCRRAKSGSG